MAKKDIIFLIGFSGSGKSTVGPALARKLGMRFIDLDTLIEGAHNTTIAEIFRTKGERAFRRMESAMLKNSITLARGRAVIALGGGAVVVRENRQSVAESGLAVYLSCSAREIYRRLSKKQDRPLLNVRPGPGETLSRARMRRITGLLESRRRYYRMSDVMVSTTTRTVTGVVNEVERKINRFVERDQSQDS